MSDTTKFCCLRVLIFSHSAPFTLQRIVSWLGVPGGTQGLCCSQQAVHNTQLLLFPLTIPHCQFGLIWGFWKYFIFLFCPLRADVF